MATIKGTKLAMPLYVIMDETGRAHLYTADPLDPANADREVTLEALLSDWTGSGSLINPVVLNLSGGVLRRGEPFTPSSLGRLRSGETPMTVRDRQGSTVTISEDSPVDGEWPLEGTVTDPSGVILADRTYALDGRCSDGEEGHSLLMMYTFPDGE